MLSKIPKHIFESMPKIVQDAWYKEAYYFNGTPIQFAVAFLSHIRNNPSEYKSELLELLNEEKEITIK